MRTADDVDIIAMAKAIKEEDDKPEEKKKAASDSEDGQTRLDI